jgi:hypothetical protein
MYLIMGNTSMTDIILGKKVTTFGSREGAWAEIKDL